MRRIGRWMLNALTALSLLLCVGTGVLWVRGPRVSDALWLQTYGGISVAAVSHQQFAILSFGQVDDMLLSMEWDAGVFWHSFEPNGYGVELGDQQGGTILSHLGFVSANTEIPTAHVGSGFARYFTSTEGMHAVYVPHALLILMLAWLPMRWCMRTAAALKRSRRLSKNRCPHCSYDLTGNVSGVCPECGRTIVNLKSEI